MMTASAGLVERDAQLAALDHLISTDGGAVVLIEGEAGAGKSALLAEALAHVPTGTAVWAGRCESLAVPAPFSALFEMLPRLPPELAESVRAGAEPISVYSAVLAAMQRRPIVLVLDDLQWADAATAGLARYVGRRLDKAPSTLLCAFRHDELDPSREAADAVAELARVSTRITLAHLSQEGIAALAHRLAPDRSIDPAAVRQATDGNPLFVVEALRNTTGVLPSSVADIVVAQVRRLPIATQQLVEAIALCPDGLAIDAALTLSPDAAEHVDLACARRVLMVVGDRVMCRHELLRDGIDAAIPPVRRRQLHRQLVTAIESQVGSDQRSDPRGIARLAYHAAAAGLVRPTIDYSIAAAITATGAGAHREAATHLMRALERSEAMDTAELDAVLRRAIHELTLIGRFEAAEGAVHERWSLAATEEARLDVLFQRCDIAYHRHSNREAARVATEVLSHHPPVGSPAHLAATSLLTRTLWGAGELSDALEVAQEALRQATAVGDPFAEARMMVWVGEVECSLRLPIGQVTRERARALALEIGATDIIAQSYDWAGRDALATLDFAGARLLLEEGLRRSETHQLDTWSAAMKGALGMLELDSANWDTALDYMKFEPERSSCPDAPFEVPYVEAAYCLRVGRTDAGTLAEALAAANDDAPYWVRARAAALALEAAWCGALDLEAARSRRDRLPIGDQLTNFWSIRALGTPGRAAATGPVATELAGDGERAAAEWDALGLTYHAALVRSALPDPPVAEVIASLQAVGAFGGLAAVRREWAARGVRTPETCSHPSGLTARHLDVLALAAAGATNAEIAEQLVLSEKTVAHHMSAILARLGVGSRRAAAALAREHDWV